MQISNLRSSVDVSPRVSRLGSDYTRICTRVAYKIEKRGESSTVRYFRSPSTTDGTDIGDDGKPRWQSNMRDIL